MADIDSSAVTVIDEWEVGDRQGKHIGKMKHVTVVLTGQGTATNKIPASAFGLTKVRRVSPFVASDDATGYFASPDYAGDNVLLFEDATDAPADQTGTFRTVVEGYKNV